MYINNTKSRLVLGRFSILPGEKLPDLPTTPFEKKAIAACIEKGFLVDNGRSVEVKAEAKPKKAEVKAEAKAEIKPEAKAEAKTEAKADSKPDSKATNKSDSKSDNKSEKKD